MDKIKILVADDIKETRDVIKKILSMEGDYFEVVGEAVNGEEVIKLIPKLKPDIVLMDINMPILNGLEATEIINDEYPSVIVIIMSVQGENEYLKKAMFYGAKEYIIKPFNYDTLITTIKTTYEKNKERQTKNNNNQKKISEARVMTFFSSKGGVGKSVLALNSAIILSRDIDKKILLIDFDLQFGDIAIMVNQHNPKTILDALDDGQLDTFENIKPYLHKYNNNLDMLFVPGKPEAAERINKESVKKIMNNFKKYYDLILVDTGINFSDNTLYVLDISEKILFVSTMEIVALKNTKLGLRVMQSLGYDNDKVKLLINRYTSNYGISKRDVNGVFKDNIFAFVPEDNKIVSISVNKGHPFCEDIKFNKTKIGKNITELCHKLVE